MAEQNQENRTLKTCDIYPNHIWMADLPYCPYCFIPAEQRIAYVQQERIKEADRKRREKKKKGKNDKN